jgi:hypothetical protein
MPIDNIAAFHIHPALSLGSALAGRTAVGLQVFDAEEVDARHGV